MPVAFGIHDLSTTGNLTRLGNNLVDGVSNGAIWALIALGYTMVSVSYTHLTLPTNREV